MSTKVVFCTECTFLINKNIDGTIDLSQNTKLGKYPVALASLTKEEALKLADALKSFFSSDKPDDYKESRF